MARENAELRLSQVSSESVRQATGRGWEEWLEVLDAAGAADWDHQAIVAYLHREHADAGSGWWKQSIAVGYEQARGKRAVGQVAGGFQVSVQRSVTVPATEAWEALTSRPELWLGEGAVIAFEEGETFKVPAADGAPGASGEVRVVKPGDRLRMTWQQEGWPGPATLQLSLLPAASGKTAIHASFEKLPDADAREVMRGRWRAALQRVAAAIS